jgi:hypothetical protein
MPVRVVGVLLPLAHLAFAAVTLAAGGAWLSAAVASLVAWLLWRRHARARFAAYVYLTMVAARSVVAARWPALAFAIATGLALQTSPALTLWPRLAPGLGRRPGDRMRRS